MTQLDSTFLQAILKSHPFTQKQKQTINKEKTNYSIYHSPPTQQQQQHHHHHHHQQQQQQNSKKNLQSFFQPFIHPPSPNKKK